MRVAHRRTAPHDLPRRQLSAEDIYSIARDLLVKTAN